MAVMDDVGYKGQKVMTDAQQFGLPCRRRRLYVLFVDVQSPRFDFKAKAIGQVFAHFRTLLSSCMRSGPGSTACMLTPTKDEHRLILEAALRDRQLAAAKSAQKKHSSLHGLTSTWLMQINWASGGGHLP